MNIQKTLKKKISLNGIGLHSGEKVQINLFPEKVDSGIFFVINKKKIDANFKNAFISQLCTKLCKKNLFISTIEHLMSALSGVGITNLKIEINKSELPILDGSSKIYIEKILEAGICDQKKTNKILKIKKKIEVNKDGKFIKIEPDYQNQLSIDCSIDFKDKYIKKQNLYYKHSFKNYLQIYDARTFCLHKDLELIFSMGLGKGGSLDNAVVVSGNKILNQGGLRYKDEFVRHKILDCIGDLYLAGYPIYGKVTTQSGGHELNILILKELFKNKNNYEII